MGKIRGSNRIALQTELIKTLETLYSDASNDPDYENSYIVFPMTKPYTNPQKLFISGMDREVEDPLGLFITSINRGNINKAAYEKIKMIFFYAPKYDILLAIDINRPDFDKELPLLLQRLKRLNALLDGTESVESLSDELETEDIAFSELSDDDKFENRKEEIKKMVLQNVAKTIQPIT